MNPEQLKRARRALGLKQTELAKRLGVHPITVSRWERGFVGIPNPVERLVRVWVSEARNRPSRRR